MCTSFVVNKNKTYVGWNLDILEMEYRVRTDDTGVFIEILDAEKGWIPLFGANSRGDFVGMPTCHPFDARSNPVPGGEITLNLDVDLLLQKKTFGEIKTLAERETIYSMPDVTFMSALSDREGNVLHIIPGQGCKYYEKPDYVVLTNFSPFKGESEPHPWMGKDRYLTADKMLSGKCDMSVADCFEVLKACSQEACPTVVSMVFDVTDMRVFWCENRKWEHIKSYDFS